VRQAKAIVVAIAKNVAAEVQATARIFVALAFIRASGVKLGKEIAAAIAKSAEDNEALSVNAAHHPGCAQALISKRRPRRAAGPKTTVEQALMRGLDTA
jgi:hypothetical protein